MKFTVLTQVFDRIEQVSARLEITRLLADVFKQTTPQEAEIIANLSLGQLHPPYIGTQFNIAEKSVIKAVADHLGVEVKGIQKEAKELGDLGVVVAQYEWKTNKELTVQQVYKALCDIEAVSGIGSQEEKLKLLRQLLADLDPVSAKYVIRIIIGKLRLGFSDMTIVDALSWMEAGDKSLRLIIENAYNVCADIGLIALTLKKNGIETVEQMHINIGIPIRPAAAERLPTPDAIIKKLGVCVAQPKLDGFRLQVHLDRTDKKTKINFFSRNLIDMSYMFPDLVAALNDLDVKEVIFEGEAIVYDPNTGGFVPFQETVKRKRKHGIEAAAQEMPLKLFLFDLLYLDGQDYLTKPHKDRRKKLEQLLKGFKSDRVMVIEEKVITDTKALEDYFVSKIAAGLEGLVVKRPDAVYQPGKRNFNWIKLKRKEEGQLEDTVDCVILGYYAGKGKRVSFGVGAFLVGVYNKKKDLFQTVAKIGTGLKDVEWKELKKKCDAIRVKEMPHNVVCAKELYPDVWVYPEIVCIVRADEITLSPLHAAGKTNEQLGYALRFPRFMGYRLDKSAAEATTAKEIARLYEDQFVKK